MTRLINNCKVCEWKAGFLMTHPSQNHLSRVMRKPIMWFPHRPDTNRDVEKKKKKKKNRRRPKAKNSELKVESRGGAGQLRSNCEAYLRLCFRMCKILLLLFFHDAAYL